MVAGAILPPNFHAMPRELCSIPRWLVWKDAKVPYCATAINRKANVTEPDTWATFSQAKNTFDEGGYSGVGFVLSGDGIVGVDLDKCVQSGQPDSAAMDVLDRVGCQYIELSPSGMGLRGFGYGGNIVGTRGLVDGVNVELYSCKRYLTVTGHSLLPGPLVPLLGFSELASAIRPTDLQKRTEDNGSNLLCSSVGSVPSSVGSLPTSTIPTEAGQRNKCLFELARYLKGTQPNATRQELREAAVQWHKQSLPVIGTKDLSVTLTDFFNAWDKVRQPYGATLGAILAKIDSSVPLPNGIPAL